MVDVIPASKLANQFENNSNSEGNNAAQRFLDDVFSGPKLTLVKDTTAPQKMVQESRDSDRPVKGVPGASIGADGYLKYHGLHLPTWSGKNPDGSSATPFRNDDGSVRKDGKLNAETDSAGRVLGADGKAVYDSSGLRRYENGSPVANKLESSDPTEMVKKLESTSTLDDTSRAQFNRAIESADKLDRVAMAQQIEKNEKFVSSHTTAFLWETGYQQAQTELATLRAEQSKSASAERQAEITAKETALAAKEAELAAKPSLKDQVSKMREANASDAESGRLLVSSADTRAAYLGKLVQQDSVKKYLNLNDKAGVDAKALEADPNVKEARRVVGELVSMNYHLPPELKGAARSLAPSDKKK